MTGGVSRNKGETQTADVHTVDLAGLHVIGEVPRHRSSVAFAVSADQVHGQTVSHEHDSKYVPSSRHTIAPPSSRNESLDKADARWH